MDIDPSDVPQLPLLSPIALRWLVSENEWLMKELERFDPVKTAATFGGLLTSPLIQSNCVRLEVLVHLALAAGKGHKTPDAQLVARAFSALGKGICGRYEDPAEDMFVTSVGTARGNFRIFEGIWESAQFYLQRFINVVEKMPRRADFDHIRESIYAILKLSDLICERAELARCTLGNPLPQQLLPKKMALVKLRHQVRFSEEELRFAAVSIEHLSQFGFDLSEKHRLLEEHVGHSTLERYPIVRHQAEYFVVLPTAISAAVRRFVLDAVDVSGNRERFVAALSSEYANLFGQTPLLGDKIGAPIDFKKTEAGLLAGVTTDVDQGRFLNFVFFVDTLEDFERTGLSGMNPDPILLADDFDKWIDQTYEIARSKSDFKNGLTLLVGCGVGRGAIHYLNNRDRPGWRVEFVSAADLLTLSWTPDFKPRSLWRLFEAQDKIKSLGVELQNINGLLNMVAWMDSLGGHLVPHGSLPDDFVREDMSVFLAIDQTSLRELRHRVARSWDSHVEQDVSGRWISVRKEGQSDFSDDQRRPLFATEELLEGLGPAAVFVSPQRPWWCEIVVNDGVPGRIAYERWKLMTVWLSRAVAILESALPNLPVGPVLLKVQFQGTFGDLTEEPKRVSYDEARSSISASADVPKRTWSLVVGAEFDSAHFNSENIAERALVDAMVEGAGRLAGKELSAEARSPIVKAIVRDSSARHAHAFRAKEFRDFLRHKLRRAPTTIDKTDDALVKIGLGWRARDKSKGAWINGKTECTEFLNRLVQILEDELCEELRAFDRQATLERILLNHEEAIVDRDQWRRTAAAVLSLHDDKEDALKVMARHDFELNAVFLGTRLLLEFAICEAPLQGTGGPGRMDLSRLMAKAVQIFALGGWSDAIWRDVMEPRLRITPLGDVHANLDFVDEVISPFAHGSNEVFVKDAVKTYAKNLDEPAPRPTVESFFEPEFAEAWSDEFGASIDETRVFVDFLEDLGLQADVPVLKVRRSELLNVRVGDRTIPYATTSALVDSFTFKGRLRWRDVPTGFDTRDVHPWRFRRRLSVLRKPLLQLNEDEDPIVIVAPGIARDALRFMVSNYHQGDFPPWQLKTKMQRWAGETARRRGSAFNHAVAERLKVLGWSVQAEVKVTKLLRKGFEQDYGDVDVLAWQFDNRRVLVIECKDVQYSKTYGEIAEQLGDFRGELNSDGKPDDLLRHLLRVQQIAQNLSAVAQFVGFSQLEGVESHLVFKNPVPMQFALRRMAERVSVQIFDKLHEI